MDEIDKKLLNILQKEFPLEEQPFQIVAEKCGISEEEALVRIQKMKDEGIIRHRGKIEGAIKSARAYLEIMENEPGGFSAYIWNFVDGKPVQNRHETMKHVPTHTPMSEALSKDLKKRGFTFCGPTIVYAFAQAVGMVNDHMTGCFRHKECGKLAKRR